MQERNISSGLPGPADRKILRILIYDKDTAERRLIVTYLSQLSDLVIEAQETDQISQLKVSVSRKETDLVLMGIGYQDEPEFWLEEIGENHLAPVIVINEPGMTNIPNTAHDNGSLTYLSKDRLTRDALLQSIESALKKWQAIKRNQAHKVELDRLANTDPLTGLLNRQAVLARLEECIANSRRYQTGLSILVLDIDHFATAIQALGSINANIVLNRIASLCEKRTRDTDYIGRYGRDEFLLVFPHTDAENATIVAERLRKLVEEIVIESNSGIPYQVSISGGLAGYKPGDDVATFTYRAESALCRAKERGRNRIEK
jgi:diguanylate cyclase (GGDEF)-like protein